MEQMQWYEQVLKNGTDRTVAVLDAAKGGVPDLTDELWETLVSAHVLSPGECSSADNRVLIDLVRTAFSGSGSGDVWLKEVSHDFILALDSQELVGSADVLDALVEMACMHESAGEMGRDAIVQAIDRFSMDIGEYPESFYPLRDRAEAWVERLGNDDRVIVDRLLVPLSRLQYGRIEELTSEESLERLAGIGRDRIRDLIAEGSESNVIDFMALIAVWRKVPNAEGLVANLQDGLAQAAAADEDLEFVSIKHEIAKGTDWALSVQYTFHEIYIHYDGPIESCPQSVGHGERNFRVHHMNDDDDDRRFKTWVGFGNRGELWATFTDGSVAIESHYEPAVFRRRIDVGD
jgi:hypothetical protein